MKPGSHRKIRLVVIRSAVLVVIFIAIMIPVRSYLLRKTLSGLSRKLSDHKYEAEWKGISFRGMKSLHFDKISVRGVNNGNEIELDSLTVKIRIIPLMFRKVGLKEVQCRRIFIHYLKNDPDSGQVRPVQHDSTGIFSKLAEIDPAELVNRYTRRFFRYVPSRADFELIDFLITQGGDSTRLTLGNFSLSHGQFAVLIELSGGGSVKQVQAKGQVDKSSYITAVRFVCPDTGFLPVPLLKYNFGIEAGFDSLDVTLDFSDHYRHLANISGMFNFSGFELGGGRLSSESIKINRFTSSFLVHLGNDYAELDSATGVNFNNIRLRPYFRLTIASDPQVDFRLLPVSWDAGDFFSSLPVGMFSSLIGLRAEGTLHYGLRFSVDMNNPDSLLFNTRLTSDHFRILEYGNDDYRKINGSFNHMVYERGQLKTAFVVGMENPDFVDLGHISPFLQAAVMTSEDGSFYSHNGFNPEAFRESIAANIHENRFARGGSTLSMQLVKNVFLTRSKTIARKIEEALIVWLIENQNLVSKRRMYEVYLNVIEWGPGIYGINQASWFYFKKKPIDLNLQESIFLASIVPNPKWYRYTFESNGVPRPFFANYFQRMEELMVRKEFITEADTSRSDYLVRLMGRAADAFAGADTVRTDSLILKELETIPAVVKLKIGDHR